MFGEFAQYVPWKRSDQILTMYYVVSLGTVLKMAVWTKCVIYIFGPDQKNQTTTLKNLSSVDKKKKEWLQARFYGGVKQILQTLQCIFVFAVRKALTVSISNAVLSYVANHRHSCWFL